MLTYSSDKNLAANLETITAARAREIIEMNKQGKKPLSLIEDHKHKETPKPVDLLAGADVSRFDKKNWKKKGGKPRGKAGKPETPNVPVGENTNKGNRKPRNKKPDNKPQNPNGKEA